MHDTLMDTKIYKKMEIDVDSSKLKENAEVTSCESGSTNQKYCLQS